MEHGLLEDADGQFLTGYEDANAQYLAEYDFGGSSSYIQDIAYLSTTDPGLDEDGLQDLPEPIFDPDGSYSTVAQMEVFSAPPPISHLSNIFADFVAYPRPTSKVSAFFEFWAAKHLAPINEEALDELSLMTTHLIDARALSPGANFQGISFDALGVCPEDVERYRRMVFRKSLNNPSYRFRYQENKRKEEVAPRKLHEGNISHFRFRQMNMRCKPIVPHFQLRHTLSASSKNAVFYSKGCSVFGYYPEQDTRKRVFEVKNAPSAGFAQQGVGCLQAKYDLLVAGDEHGHYTMKCLSATYNDSSENGIICDGSPQLRMTNHVALSLHRRSGLPQATFCPNDNTLRTLDCCTARFIYKHTVDWPVNCSSISPDARLRLIVGDGCEPLVMDAERGTVIHRLPNHDDYGFACDWADNGIHMATGNQDGKTQIWDCRDLSQPLHVLAAEITAVRTLQFSPVGSGRRVLVMAEDVDYVSIVDATTFETRQRFGVLGEISGISLVPEGDKLFVGVADGHFGGIAEFDRCDYGHDHREKEDFHTWAPDNTIGDDRPIRILDPSCYQDWSSTASEGLARGSVL